MDLIEEEAAYIFAFYDGNDLFRYISFRNAIHVNYMKMMKSIDTPSSDTENSTKYSLNYSLILPPTRRILSHLRIIQME